MNIAPRRRWLTFSLRTMFVLVTIAGCSFAAWLYRGYIPGTVHLNKNGFARGTGTLRGCYPNGSIKLEDYCRNGRLIRQTWYRPDGSVYIVSEFDVKTGGMAYVLDDNGNLTTKFHGKYSVDKFGEGYRADSLVAHYKPDGSLDHYSKSDGTLVSEPIPADGPQPP